MSDIDLEDYSKKDWWSLLQDKELQELCEEEKFEERKLYIGSGEDVSLEFL